jgi:hypothetical protein
MDNFEYIDENEVHTDPSGKRAKPDKRWTILFIGNHGRTITLKRFKGMVLLTFLVLCISIAITVGLLYLTLNIRGEKDQLESDMMALKAQIKSLRYEKDVLMTKLVLAETRSKPKPVEEPKSQAEPDNPPPETVDKEKPKPVAPVAKVKKEPPIVRETEPRPVSEPPEPRLSVAVENFKITPRVDENLLRVEFKIMNTSPDSQRVSGHAIVVLKADQVQQNRWLTIPRIPLTNGKPTGRQRGYSFGINHFKTMRLKTNLPKSPEIYQSAIVFVYTGQGELLHEQEFPVNIPPLQAATESRPPVKTPMPSSGSSSSRSFAGPSPVSSTKPTGSPTTAKPSTSTAIPPTTDELINSLRNSTSE